MPDDRSSPDPVDPARRGGRIAIALFGVMVVSVLAVWTTQITKQVFTSASPSGSGGRDEGCRSGLSSLSRALDAARSASDRVESSPEEALTRFRAALSPAWDAYDRVAATCQREADPTLLQALDTIDRLRYAEENSIRRDARDLGLLRRRMRALRETVLVTPP